MGLILTVTAGLVIWIVLWTLLTSGFDAFLLAAVVILIGASVKILSGYLPSRRASAQVACEREPARPVPRTRGSCPGTHRGGRRGRRPERLRRGWGLRRGSDRRQPADRLLQHAAPGRHGGVAEQIVNGEKLALSEAGGRAGAFKISFVSLNDAKPATGQWDPEVTATEHKTAAQDTEHDRLHRRLSPCATPVSLPLIDAAGVSRWGRASPYVGLTSSLDAGQGEPERFYLSGKRTFGRLLPGDPVQAAAQAWLMKSLSVGKVYVLDNQDPFEEPLARLVAEDAEHAGITVAGQDSLATTATPCSPARSRRSSKAAHRPSSSPAPRGPERPRCGGDLHIADPHLWLLAPSTLTGSEFTAWIGTAGERTLLTTPIFPSALYPPSAKNVLSTIARPSGSPPNRRRSTALRR